MELLANGISDVWDHTPSLSIPEKIEHREHERLEVRNGHRREYRIREGPLVTGTETEDRHSSDSLMLGSRPTSRRFASVGF